jgi:hypothetical protein
LKVISRARTSQSSGGDSGSDNGDSGDNNGGNKKPGGTTSDPDKGFTTKVANMGALLPKTFSDYFLGDLTTTANEAQVSGTPLTAGQEANQLIWTVHQTGSKAEATQFVTSVSKNLYANDAAAVTVDGVQAYFGTDGTRFATIAYVRGIYVFEVLITGNGTQPKSLKTLAHKAGLAFADAPK